MSTGKIGRIFIDTSAFIALYVKSDEFHKEALQTLEQLKKNSEIFTSNFILDEVYTFLRARYGKKIAVAFSKFITEDAGGLFVVRTSVEDEEKALDYFNELDGRGVSYTDCASFACMKRLNIETAFSF